MARTFRLTALFLLIASLPASAQAPDQTNDPFAQPIAGAQPPIVVDVADYAMLPDTGAPARMMLLIAEPGGRRLFVNDMRGPLYTVAENGARVQLYVDTNDPKWGVPVQSQGNERGFQSFAIHPQFLQRGTPGFGKFYTYADTPTMTPPADFTAAGATNSTHDTLLLEWTAKDPAAAVYDGGAPRELMRIRQPFQNHNAGHLAFNPLAAAGSPEFGLLYMGVADGGSGGDPLNLSQNLGSIFGKILRLDPLGTNSANKKYGIPASNPFVADKSTATLDEIYALGVRNPQRFAWDPRNGNMFLADIGQNIVEEVSLVTAGANLGWNQWEGSFRYVSRQAVSLQSPRSDPKMVYPVVEYGQPDPLLQGSSAATGVVVYRGDAIPALANLVLFGDNPSGEVFAFSADTLPAGGQDAIRRVMLRQNGQTKTLLQLIADKRSAAGRNAAPRADLRFGTGPDNQVFLLNKQDNTIRLLVAGGAR